MNIGIVTTWLERGAAYVSKAYMDAFQTHGHSVFIYARGGETQAIGDPNWDLPNVTWSKRYRPISRISKFNAQYVDMLAFEKWLRENSIDIVLFNEEKNVYTVQRVRDLGYTTGAYIDYYKKETVNSFRAYDFLLCNTQRHYSVFSEFPSSQYVPWGTDVDLFQPKTKKKPKSSDEPVVFFHSAGWGGINLRKGTDLALEAFQEVQGNAKLIIHSQVPISKYGNKAKAIIEKDSRIDFLKKTVTPPGLYHLGDVFVYPTRLEGIGLCVPEALACGLPVITTSSAPMNEFVHHDVNGLLVAVAKEEPREDGYYWPQCIADVNDLTKKMQTYVDDRTQLERHQASARTFALKHLDWKKNVEPLCTSLPKLVAPRTRRSLTLAEKIKWWLEAKHVAMLTILFHTTYWMRPKRKKAMRMSPKSLKA